MSVASVVLGLEGRLNRARYWIAVLALLPLSFVTFLIAVSVIGLTVEEMKTGTAEAQRKLSIAQLIQMAIVGWPLFAISAKRFQDRGKPAWLALAGVAAFAIPSIAGAIDLGGTQAAPTVFAGAASLVALAVGLWWFVELGCLRGTAGPNRYGNDPLGRV